MAVERIIGRRAAAAAKTYAAAQQPIEAAYATAEVAAAEGQLLRRREQIALNESCQATPQ